MYELKIDLLNFYLRLKCLLVKIIYDKKCSG